jgi:hypothetical protein
MTTAVVAPSDVEVLRAWLDRCAPPHEPGRVVVPALLHPETPEGPQS